MFSDKDESLKHRKEIYLDRAVEGELRQTDLRDDAVDRLEDSLGVKGVIVYRRCPGREPSGWEGEVHVLALCRSLLDRVAPDLATVDIILRVLLGIDHPVI